jgi:hypothetical protein
MQATIDCTMVLVGILRAVALWPGNDNDSRYVGSDACRNQLSIRYL